MDRIQQALLRTAAVQSLVFIRLVALNKWQQSHVAATTTKATARSLDSRVFTDTGARHLEKAGRWVQETIHGHLGILFYSAWEKNDLLFQDATMYDRPQA